MADAQLDTPQIIEAEDSVSSDDNESAYGSGAPSDTTSLASEVRAYIYENGRRYHAYSEGHYWAPNDGKQNEQLDIFHHVYSLVLDGDLHLAPIGDHPQKILDLGTGTGIWAIDMADTYPSAQVIGNDLSPIQPNWVPANCQFEVDDFTKPWAHSRNSFDFVHARGIYGSVGSWPILLREAYSRIKPGGWFESVETTVAYYHDDGPRGEGQLIPKDNPVYRWCQFGREAAERIGKPFDVAGKVGGWMEDAGFINVTQKEYKVPSGPWPRDPRMKDIGKYNLLNMLEAIEGFTIALFTRVLGWSLMETQVILAQVRTELSERRNHFYFKMYVAYGQKPEIIGLEG